MDFFKERNLWQIYRESRVIPISKINKYITLLILLIAILNGITLSTSELYEVIKITSGSLFGVILTTLGFLVAGYTIFCTVLPLELQKQMMDTIDEETNLTYIKKFHFLFLRVFFYFVVFSGILFIINFFQGSSGLIFKLTSNNCVFFALNFVGYCFIISFTIFY
ncbi:hypothetical protein VXG46_001934 [Acinetobacter baumannii]|uniref:Uncharacterized protein n=1 Tax=Acinetobacter baumannii TaxID=470 RepID=A0A7U7KCV1_ACIBA|nr:hypothetical protein [Acinetobacter baumannii]EJB8496444.1 hypothetical protein [Acinetobacter baumannii]EMC7951161.1 hypothetical protein [Acinetobacter baumannii]EMD9692781.1 hypothetical protein [Acinetobacter baumannii]MDV7430549.1 hypothetical protein [Acinetobacter baumannii]CDM71354.1 hypothetical protein ABP630_0892 [Acinetobacter baumannii P630]